VPIEEVVKACARPAEAARARRAVALGAEWGLFLENRRGSRRVRHVRGADNDSSADAAHHLPLAFVQEEYVV